MSLRNLFLVSTLLIVGLCFFAANQASNVGIYITAGLTIAIIANSLTALSLAIFTLRSMGLLYVSRASTTVIFVIALTNSPSPLILASFIASIIVHSCLFSEAIISKIARSIGATNEDMFILKTPLGIALWFTFTWSVVWATFAESIHLFHESKNILGVIAVLFALLITGVFIFSQLRTLYRRCVIVPHGIVASDPISLTDVVLLPLSKIATIELIENLDINKKVASSTFAGISSIRNVVAINLSESTDSLIVRNSINETERKNVNQLMFSIADPKSFVATFHQRFHKVTPEPLTKSQEKMVEKELGITTAPRSDAPLPAHRPKKPKN